MKISQKILILISAVIMTAIVPISVSAMSTQDFDNGMAKGIDYFNSGLYYEAKDEFQWFCDANWGNMNSGQQQYALDYLGGTKAKIQQWENLYKYKSVLINYAKNYLTHISDKYRTYYDVRFLFADFTGDGIDELVAVGIGDGELQCFKIYQYENGNIRLIDQDHYLGYEQHRAFIARYNGEYFVGYENFSSATGFLKTLDCYNGNSWYGVYYSKNVYDWNNDGKFKGYMVSGNYVSESQYKNFDNIFYAAEVPMGDFCKISQLY